MPRERTVQAFIIKRSDFGESDQIITLFTKEEGKIRVLVKAAKLPTSKLQPLLQPLFQTRVSLAGQKESSLGKVTGVELIQAYSKILEDEAKLAAWYVVSEILIRAVPDSAPNDSLYNEFEQYARFLHSENLDTLQIKQSVIQFQIKALYALGLGIRFEADNLWFSLDRGGFMSEPSVDAIPVKKEMLESFKILAQESYQHGTTALLHEQASLSQLINRFVVYQLEREIKSQQLLSLQI